MKLPNTITEQQLLRDSPSYFIHNVFGYLIADHHFNILEHFKTSATTLDLAPRGAGKSRIGNIGYTSWLVCNNPNIRILILSDTDRHSTRFLSTIKNVLTNSTVIKENYGDIVGGKWSDHELTTAYRTDESLTEASITALGMLSGAVTTGHYNIVIADDVCNFENTRTKGMRERAKTFWKTTVSPTILPGGEVRALATRYHFDDLSNMFSNELGFDTQIQPAILNIGTQKERSLWEHFMPLHTRIINGQKVKGLVEIRDGVEGTNDAGLGHMIFDLQYQNNCDLMSESKIFKYNDFRFYLRMHNIDGTLYAEVEE